MNVTGNYLLAREAGWIFRDQKLPASLVLTSSANAVVSKSGSEAYDVSKAALSHLVRELAVETRAARARKRNCSCNSCRRIDHVSPRSRDAIAHKIQDRVFGIRID